MTSAPELVTSTPGLVTSHPDFPGLVLTFAPPETTPPATTAAFTSGPDTTPAILATEATTGHFSFIPSFHYFVH